MISAVRTLGTEYVLLTNRIIQLWAMQVKRFDKSQLDRYTEYVLGLNQTVSLILKVSSYQRSSTIRVVTLNVYIYFKSRFFMRNANINVNNSTSVCKNFLMSTYGYVIRSYTFLHDFRAANVLILSSTKYLLISLPQAS